VLDLLQVRTNGDHEEMRQSKGEIGRPKRGGGVTWMRWNRRRTAAVLADFGERFHRPSGVSGTGR
jgi:hypothetical protein